MAESTKTPRVILVTRPTDLEALVRRHGTREQARFFLRTRDQRLEPVEERHQRFVRALETVSGAIPARWRRGRVDRADLCRFVFEPDGSIDACLVPVVIEGPGHPVIQTTDPCGKEVE